MKNCLMVFLMLFGMNAYSEVHRWVDENNRVHYSDLPPPSATTKKLHSSSNSQDAANTGDSTPASVAAATKTLAEREAELRKAQKDNKDAAEKAAQKQAKEDSKKDFCDQAQKSLRTYQEGTRIMDINANGEHAYLDDAQRQQRIAKTQQDISTNCK